MGSTRQSGFNCRIDVATGVLLVTLGLGLSGCQQRVQVLRFAKPGATNEQFQKDRYECIQQSKKPVSGAYVNAYGGGASSNVVVDRGTLVSCLAVKGYTVSPEGEFTAPPGGVVPLAN
jgi:hypothetical protein